MMTNKPRKHPDAVCENCTLYDRGKYVPSEGPADAELAIVGEAPGRDEVKHGRPFVGISGKLLNSVLDHHGIERDGTFVTNAVLCRPPGNDTPDAKATECCYPRLRAEIDSRPIKTIVALGNSAASIILDRTTKITKDRVGPPKQSPLWPGIDIIPTIHPAACLRRTDHFPHLVTDIGKLKHSAKVAYEPPRYKVFDNSTQATIALTQLLNDRVMDPITLDLEVGVDKDEAFTHPKRVLSAGICYAPGRVAVLGSEALRSQRVKDLLVEVTRTKKVICHNGKFDLQVLYNTWGTTSSLWFDTMLASYCLDERPGTHGLKYLAKELLGAPDWDAAVKGYKNFADIPRDTLYQYNAYDAALTYDLFELQQQTMNDDNRKLHEFLVRASNRIMYIEADGVRINERALEKLNAQFHRDIETLRGYLQQLVGDNEYNPNSVPQTKAILEQLLQKHVSTTDADFLQSLLDARRVPEPTKEYAKLMLEWRNLTKQHGTYIKGLLKRLASDGRIHTTYLLHGTTTGRLSSRNPNLQNIPRDVTMRDVFIPDDGNVFIGADYANIEGRVVCVLSRSESMRQVFNEGRDIHGEVAARFFGSTYTKEQRVLAKSVVHGVNYGRTPKGIAEGLNVSVRQAEGVYRAYFSMFPEVKTWQASIKDKVLRRQEPLVSPYGNKRTFGLITRDNAEDVYKEALAWQPQNIASNICLDAAVTLHEKGYKVRMLIHDEIVVECAEADAVAVTKEVEREMIEAAERFTDYVRFDVDIDVGKSWAEV